jgi:hypothetical protein
MTPAGIMRFVNRVLTLTFTFFDDFFKTYSSGFTSEQVTAWNQFKQTFEEYGDKLPSYPEPRMVIDDPDWQLVREAAARFVITFEKKTS